MDNNAVFWDKHFTRDEVKKILNDGENPKFVGVAAILLSRLNKPGEVFASYLSKITFCNNWRKIKRQMRKNKWNDARIIFWDEVYKVTLQDIDKKILTNNPFAVLDQEGVGALVRMGIKKGRSTKPKLEVGICGEHGGEPSSVEFCHRSKMNYVSCSPFRVPIACLAAAQAAIKNGK